MRDIYLDNHSTTPVDPRVLEAMLPWFNELFANPGSSTHEFGRSAKEKVEEAIASIADYFAAEPEETIITSGATESNNLAIFGIANHPRQKRRKIVSICTEHQATLGPLNQLKKQGFEVVFLPVIEHEGVPSGSKIARADQAGLVDLDLLESVIDENTALVSVMLANNEIGVIQPLQEIVTRCNQFEIPVHTDATQAVGRVDTRMDELGVTLLSFSAHKIYGPKGVGGLVVRNTFGVTRLSPQIVGGGQQHNLRSGTLNSPGIIGMAAAVDLLRKVGGDDHYRARQLRKRLWDQLHSRIPDLLLNGPGGDWLNDSVQPVDVTGTIPSTSEQSLPISGDLRLVNNLNVCFPKVDGQSLMLEVPNLAISSGSACTSAHPEPSHVLRGIGRSEDQSRSSLRFGIGRFNSEPEIDLAVDLLVEAYEKLLSFVA